MDRLKRFMANSNYTVIMHDGSNINGSLAVGKVNEMNRLND